MRNFKYLLILAFAAASNCSNVELLAPSMDSSSKIGLVPTSQPLDIPTLFSYTSLVRDAVISKIGEEPKESKNFENKKSDNNDILKASNDEIKFKLQNSLYSEFLGFSDGKVSLFSGVEETKKLKEIEISGDIKLSKIVYSSDRTHPIVVLVVEKDIKLEDSESRTQNIIVFDKDHKDEILLENLPIDTTRADITATTEFIAITFIDGKSKISRIYFNFSKEGKIEKIGNLINITELVEDEIIQIQTLSVDSKLVSVVSGK